MGEKLIINSTSFKGLVWVENPQFEDERGSFSNIFDINSLSNLFERPIIFQVNISINNIGGTVRGMHFQRYPKGETKLVRCLSGKVWDVVVDLRKGSETFLNFFGIELSEDNRKMIIIPEGFGHGFQVIIPNSKVLYLHTNEYSPQYEGGINPLDPRIGIKWPLPITLMSKRDSQFALVNELFEGI